MWSVKTFKTRESMTKWLERRDGMIQFQEIFINNRYGVEWRNLRILG